MKTGSSEWKLFWRTVILLVVGMILGITHIMNQYDDVEKIYDPPVQSMVKATVSEKTIIETESHNSHNVAEYKICYEFVNLRMDPQISENLDNIIGKLREDEIVDVDEDVIRKNNGYVWVYVTASSLGPGWVVGDAVTRE